MPGCKANQPECFKAQWDHKSITQSPRTELSNLPHNEKYSEAKHWTMVENIKRYWNYTEITLKSLANLENAHHGNIE